MLGILRLRGRAEAAVESFSPTWQAARQTHTALQQVLGRMLVPTGDRVGLAADNLSFL
jgi:hypothetical protein